MTNTFDDLRNFKEVESIIINSDINYITVNKTDNNEFDYTIYDLKTAKLIDGGILECSEEVSNIVDAVGEIIALNGDGKTYKICSLNELQAIEVAERIKFLRLENAQINYFTKDNLLKTNEYNCEVSTLTEEQIATVKQLEAKYNAAVYHVTEGYYRMMDGDVMKMENYLYVSDSIEEWAMDRDDLKQGYAYCYVKNITVPEFSELGSVGFKPVDGGLIRDDYGYDFKVMSEQELAKKIDNFMREVDPYEYSDAEIYSGSNFDFIKSDVKKCNLEHVKTYLNELVGENIYKREAKELLSDIKAFEKDFELKSLEKKLDRNSISIKI